nr:PREDICTED: receptor-transporting protein 2-like isoform X1 [Anolis carolinensis]|eukprot:XP_008120854.1 PREDICTED: receptor-transporting protein 2-like isoform X1 [Anolis carolinensis]
MDYWRAAFEALIRAVKPNDAWRLTMDQTLDFYKLPHGWKRSVQKHAHASFTCSQCFRHWTSHQVVILFHLFWDPYMRQGSARMRFFRQQCLVCHSKYEEPEFTEEAVMKVLNHLIISIRKNCYGEPFDDTELVEVVYSTGPHMREYCEAYQLGIHKGRYSSLRSGGHDTIDPSWVQDATDPSWVHESTGLLQTTEQTGTPAPSSRRPNESSYLRICLFICFICVILLFLILFLVYWNH